MTDSAPTVLTPGRAKVTVAGLLGMVLALAAALLNGTGGGDLSITTAPHPGLAAQVAALDTRLASIERRVEEGHAQAALIEGLRQRLDLLLSGARVRLDAGEPPPRRGR